MAVAGLSLVPASVSVGPAEILAVVRTWHATESVDRCPMVDCFYVAMQALQCHCDHDVQRIAINLVRFNARLICRASCHSHRCWSDQESATMRSGHMKAGFACADGQMVCHPACSSSGGQVSTPRQPGEASQPWQEFRSAVSQCSGKPQRLRRCQRGAGRQADAVR